MSQDVTLASVTEADDAVASSRCTSQANPNELRLIVQAIHDAAAGCDGSILLVALTQPPHCTKSQPAVFEFNIDDVDGMTAKALELASKPWTNVYWVNSVMPKGVSSKGSWGKRDDVVAVIGQVIDADADRGKEGKVPLSPTLTLRTCSSPSVNRHHLYLYPPSSRPSVEDAVRHGEMLRRAAGADLATGVVPHLYRLPGTFNWPTPNKLEKGRPREPQPVTLEGEIGSYVEGSAFESLSPAEKPRAVANASATLPCRALSPRVVKLLERRDISGDRSKSAWAAIHALKKEGMTAAEIKATILSYPNGVGERYVRNSSKLDGEIKRAFQKGDGDAVGLPSCLDDAAADRHEDQEDMPAGFWRHRDGYIYGTLRREVRPLCSPLRILGRASDPDGGNWARVVEIRTPEAKVRRVLVSESDIFLQSGENDVVRTLASEGLTLCSTDVKNALRELILQSPATELMRTVKKPGWCDNGFALPMGIVSSASHQEMIWSGEARDVEAFASTGTLEDWIEHVAKPAVEHPILLTSLAAAFAGPLLGVVGAPEGFGLHLHGASSSGKTTAAQVAASVWGPPEKFVRPWRGTDNGLEAVAASRNHTLLVLDELNQVDPKVAHACAYMLAGGQGKTRMTKTTALRKTADWSVVMVSTGEESFANYLRRGPNGRAKAGQTVRMIDLPVPLKDGDRGVFTGAIASADLASELARELKTATRRHHGTAGVRLVERLESDRDRIPEVVAEIREGWRRKATKLLGGTVDGQVSRIIDHMGLIATAGILASKAGVLPTTPKTVVDALLQVLTVWVDRRGGSAALEERQAVEAVRSFLATEAWRFIDKKSSTSTLPNRAGTRYVERCRGGDRLFYAIQSDVFQGEVCAGLDHRAVARVLRDKHWLHCDNDGHLTRKVSLDPVNLERSRCYCVSADILEGD